MPERDASRDTSLRLFRSDMIPSLIAALATPPDLIHQPTPSDEQPCAIDSEAAWRSQVPRGTLSLAAGLGPQLPPSSSSRVSEAASLAHVRTALSSGRPTLIMFYASWCPHCKRTKPVFDRVADQTPGAAFLQIDASTIAEVRAPFEVRAYPTIKFFDSSNPAGLKYAWHGANEADLLGFVQRKLGPAPAPAPVAMVQMHPTLQPEPQPPLQEARGAPVWDRAVWRKAFGLPAAAVALLDTGVAAAAGSAAALSLASSDKTLTPTATTTECQYDVAISGAGGEADDAECFSAPATLTVSGDSHSVVVWDEEEGLCGSGEMYIHYAPGKTALPMTAGAGSTKHKYKACYFDTVPVSDTGCQTFDDAAATLACLTSCRSDAMPSSKTWRVARAETSCDEANAYPNATAGASK